MRPLRLLVFTTLYPNAVRRSHGIFVETRLRHLCARHPVEARVVAPVPWFPFSGPRFGQYARYAATPRAEVLNGIEVTHPRYALVPKIGMTLAPFGLALSGLQAARAQIASGFDFDVIDAHYFYPDGVAAAAIGRCLGKPVTVTARGSDINLIARHALPRRMIRWAAANCAGLVAVCEALAEAMRDLGIEHPPVRTVRNGVDLELFRPPADRAALRAGLGITRRTLLSVGNLLELKGHHLIIDALPGLPDTDLIIVGQGPERAALEARARSAGVSERVRMPGSVPQEALRDYYGAADALVLASSREGWANVLLESMACGTPVVATAVSGTPEVVTAAEAGRLVESRSSASIAAGVRALFDALPERAQTRRYAERFSWDGPADSLFALFSGLTGSREVPVAG